MQNKAQDRALAELYVLPSARTKRRKIKKARDKKLLDLEKERLHIWNTIHNLGYEDLFPPVQRGWKRLFVLRNDVAESKYAECYQQILDTINKIAICHRKDFKVKKRRQGKRYYVKTIQELESLTAWDLSKSELSEEQKALFLRVEYYCPFVKAIRVKYEFKEPWRFVLRVQPNMITKTRIRDWELESKLKQIDNYLKRNNLQYRIDKLRGRRNYRYWYYIWNIISEKPKYKFNPLKGRSIQTIEEEYREDIQYFKEIIYEQ